MSNGADWDAILATDPQLDLDGLDVNTIVERLGVLEPAERDALVARIDEEKAKVVQRGDLIDTALDIFKAAIGAVV